MREILFIFLFCISVGKILAADFITRWDLKNPGIAPDALTFAVGTTGIVNYTWESIPSGTSGSGSFSGNLANITGLPAGAMIRLHIAPTNFNRFFLNMGPSTDCYRLTDVEQWGSVNWQSMEDAFSACQNLNISALDIPDLSLVTSCQAMFYNCVKLSGPSNIHLWDVSHVKDMYSMFNKAALFNQPIGDWNVSNVTDMSSMFQQASVFNKPIGDWDISKVASVANMFNGTIFNQPLSNWNVSNLTNLNYMFCGAYAFNQSISNWNVSNVTEMNYTFHGARFFNQPIGDWDVSNVRSMKGLFGYAENFNQPIGNWNISKVKDMSFMFASATKFLQPIFHWDVSHVTNMSGMFNGIKFNQPIGNWDVSNVTNMSYMFSGTDFNQPIGNWDVSNVTNMSSMFSGTEFNQPIGNWKVSKVTDMGAMFSNNKSFNQPIASWDVSKVTTLYSMFENAIQFNQPIGNWNVSNVSSMHGMFEDAKSFNQPIGAWDVSNVKSIWGMFENATLFNQPIGDWNVSNLTHMTSAFRGASNFNQDLGKWNIAKVCCASGMLDKSGMDCSNYSATLFGWYANPNCPNEIELGASSLEYGLNVKSIRYDFKLKKNWKIEDDHAGTEICCFLQNTTLYQDTCASYIYRGTALASSGAYNDTLVNSWGCDSLITLNLKIYDSPNSLVVYPNPASTHLNINTIMACEKVEKSKKELYNSIGQLIFTTKEDVIDVSTYQKGIYFLKYLHYVVKVLVQ